MKMVKKLFMEKEIDNIGLITIFYYNHDKNTRYFITKSQRQI